MKTILCSFIAILFSIATFSQTPVPPGPISGTWTVGGEPYLIEGETTIENGTTLTIEAGVHVIWQNDSSSMWVEGQILAIGTEADSIVFTAADPLTGWEGVRFDSTLVTNDTSRFEYCVFEYAKAYGPYPDNSGGAIGAVEFGKIIIDHCYFHDNKAVQVNTNLPGGGAIGLWASSPVIRNCTFINNVSYAGGAILCWIESQAIIENNLFTNNTAEFGGAIYCFESDPPIKYNLFYDNIAHNDGGAISLEGNCSPDIINNTIVNNVANDAGGGIDIWQESSPMILNTILWENTADEGNQVCIWDGCVPNFFYCDVEGGQAGFGGVPHTGEYKQCFDDDPLFGGPPDYSLTWVNEPIPDSTKSPCIDTGDPTMFDPDGTRCDVGALYYDQDSVSISDLLPKNKLTWIHCYPNPTNGKSDIRYQISEIRSVSLTVHDITGKQVKLLTDETQNAGEHVVRLDITDLPDGLYMIRLQSGNESAVGKLLVVH